MSSPLVTDDNQEQQVVSNMDEMDQDNDPLTVDFSSQGLTMVPSTLFNRTDITSLNLSGNNIRVLPLEIMKLEMLKKLDVSRNGLRCMHVNDFSSLPKEMEHLEFLEELNISECNLMFIPATVWRLTCLTHLDISRNKINNLPSEIGNLCNMKYINAQHTGIKTLPQEIVCCEELEELHLFGNPIEGLPDTMRELMSLHTVTINSRIFCKKIDSNMTALLKKGQIISEHIPGVLFDMPALRALDIEQCKINNLPNQITTSLQYLNLAKNFFTKLPSVVATLKTLTLLDISNNEISVLPEFLKELESLKTLTAEKNSISVIIPELSELEFLENVNFNGNKIKHIPVEFTKLQNLKTLSLENNRLSGLPDSLCDMVSVETLNLTGNKITQLPSKMYKMTNLRNAHKFNGLFKTGLWLHKNPLINPPEQIWKTDNTELIWDYLRRMEIQNIKQLQRTKVFVIGDYQSGKTSLLRSFLSGRPHATKAESDTTLFFSSHNWISPNKCRIQFIDVGIHELYETFVPKLLDNHALYYLVFDTSRYAVHGFDMIGSWLRLLQQHVPKVNVKLIGTKVDALIRETEQGEKDVVLDEVNDDNHTEEENADESDKSEVDIFAEEEAAAMQQYIKETMEAAPSPDEGNGSGNDFFANDDENSVKSVLDPVEALRSQLEEDLQNFQQRNFETQRELGLKEDEILSVRLLEKISFTCCKKELVEVRELSTELEQLVTNIFYFPEARRYVPKVWNKFAASLKKRRNKFFWTMQEVVQMAMNEKFNMKKDQVEDCLHFLHSTGKLIWQSRIQNMRGTIFHRPDFLKRTVDCICRIAQEDFLDYENNRSFKCRGHLSREQFEEAAEQLRKYGEFSLPMLSCFLLEMQIPRVKIGHVSDMLHRFGIGIRINTPDIPLGRLHCQPVFLVPSLITETATVEEVEEVWPSQNKAIDGMVINFPYAAPTGLWEELSVALHEIVIYRLDWNDLVYARSTGIDYAEMEPTDSNEEEEISMVHILLKQTDPRDPECQIQLQLYAHDSIVSTVTNIKEWFTQWLNDYKTYSPGVLFQIDEHFST